MDRTGELDGQGRQRDAQRHLCDQGSRRRSRARDHRIPRRCRRRLGQRESLAWSGRPRPDRFRRTRVIDQPLPGQLLDIAVIDILGSNGQRILGGIVPFAGSTWFFKLTGPDAVVAAEKPAFVEYMKTVRTP